MVLPDVNVLVYAFREAAPRHEEYRDWLHGIAGSREAFGLSELVLGGAIRVLTHPASLLLPRRFPRALAREHRYLAALAIEHGCEWVTSDRDFARFPGLRWRHPLE